MKNGEQVDTSTLRTAVAITDQHIPYVDDTITQIQKDYIADTQPDEIVFMGDLIDNPAMSDFDPDPDHMRETQEEIDMGARYLNEFKKISPDSDMAVLYGNHDWGRMDRVKHINGYALKNMRVFKFKSLLKESARYQGLEYNLDGVKFGHEHEIGVDSIETPHAPGVKFIHGDKRMDTKLKGGVTGPRRNAREYPYQGHVLAGHKHRALTARDQWRDRKFVQVAASADPDELEDMYNNHAQYERGFAVVHYNLRTKEPEFHIQNIRLENDKHAVVDGKIYEG